MKLYNRATDKIESRKSIKTEDGTLYPNKLSDEQLNSHGYYRLKYESAPNRRYYDLEKSSSVIGSEYVVGYTSTEKSLDGVKEAMFKDLKATFLTNIERPTVDTGLGYTIDGGRSDLGNFEVGKEFGVPFIKGSDGVNHPATASDYDACILAIKSKGMELYSIKWGKEEEIKAFTTLGQCIDYEATAYDYTVTEEDVSNDIDGNLTVGQVLTKYKNNVKEW